jgi:hypothetical protein
MSGAGSQLSVAVTASIFSEGSKEAHSTVSEGGQVIVGAMVSCTTMVALQVDVFKQSSVAVQVLVTL